MGRQREVLKRKKSVTSTGVMKVEVSVWMLKVSIFLKMLELSGCRSYLP